MGEILSFWVPQLQPQSESHHLLSLLDSTKSSQETKNKGLIRDVEAQIHARHQEQGQKAEGHCYALNTLVGRCH